MIPLGVVKYKACLFIEVNPCMMILVALQDVIHNSYNNYELDSLFQFSIALDICTVSLCMEDSDKIYSTV